MTREDDDAVTLAMCTYGGSFTKALGEAWRRADGVNAAKLKSAFPELWSQYIEVVALARGRAVAP